MFIGRATFSPFVYQWNNSTNRFQGASKDPTQVPAYTSRPLAESQRSVYRPMGKTLYRKRIYTSGSSNYCEPFFKPGSRQVRLCIADHSSNTLKFFSAAQFLDTSGTVSGYNSVTMPTGYSLTGHTLRAVTNEDPTKGNVNTFFFLTTPHATSGQKVVRFIENPAGGITVLDDIVIDASDNSIGFCKPFWDGDNLWFANGNTAAAAPRGVRIRRVTGVFGNAGSLTEDPTVYASLPAGQTIAGISYNHFAATDGRYTYFAIPGNIAGGQPSYLTKLDKSTLTGTQFTYSNPAQFLSGMSFDGNCLYAWDSVGSIKRYDPATMTHIQGGGHFNTGLSPINYTNFKWDGRYFWVTPVTSGPNNRCLMRLDPSNNVAINAYIGTDGTFPTFNQQWLNVETIRGDANGCCALATFQTASSTYDLYLFRDMNDASCGSISMDLYGYTSENMFFTPQADRTIVFDGGSGSTYTLPPRAVNGTYMHLKRLTTSGTMTISTSDGSTIDGAPNLVLGAGYAGATVYRANNNWFILT